MRCREGQVHNQFRKKPNKREITTVWNRDINASRNMLYKLLCLLQNIQMHPVFLRRSRQENQAERIERAEQTRINRRRQQQQ